MNNVNNMTAKENDFHLSLTLEPVKAALGVILDTNLTFNKHIVSILCLYVCHNKHYNLGQIADKSALIIIINALVFGKLFNCSSVVPPIQMNLIWTNSK